MTITNESEYQKALTELEPLMVKDPEPETEEGKRLKSLASAIEEYELRSSPPKLPRDCKHKWRVLSDRPLTVWQNGEKMVLLCCDKCGATKQEKV